MFSFRAKRAQFQIVLSSLLSIAAAILALPAQAMQPIVNGGFESGTFAGWHVETHQAAGTSPQSGAVVTGSATAPYSGTAIPLPSQGSFHAVIDAPASSSTVVTQIIGLPKASQVTLSCRIGFKSDIGLWYTPSLDYSNQSVPNQQVRVDILKPAADASSIAAADILATPLVNGLTNGGSSIPLTFDLTALAGQTVKLRIATVNNVAPMIVSIDNLKISPASGYWTITDLGGVSGTSVGLGLNDAGQVVGGVSPSGNTQLLPFVWDPANGMTLLAQVPATQTDATAQSINNSSQIAYTSTDGGFTPTRAYLRAADGTPTDLLQTLSARSEAHSINSAGRVVGAYTPNGNESYLPQQAFQWSAESGASALLSGVYQSAAYAINDSGKVVGSFTQGSNSRSHAFSWTSTGGLTDLDGANNTAISAAYGINANGLAVGFRTINDAWNNHAFSWLSGVAQDLGTASPNYPNTVAYAVNSAGTIVGEGSNRQQVYGLTMVPDFGFWAMSWKDGTPTALSTLIPTGTGWNLLTARGINDTGQIVGTGSINGQYHAYLLSPPTDIQTPGNVIVNGGFETGDFTGWNAYFLPSAQDGGYPFPLSNGWAVANQTPFFSDAVVYPIDNQTAFSSFDGAVLDTSTWQVTSPSDLQMFLEQPFTVQGLINTASLQFTFEAARSFWSPATMPRTFDVRLLDASRNVIATVYTHSVPQPLSGELQTITKDITSALKTAGPGTYTLQFREDVPEAFTGTGVFAIDDVSLTFNAPAPPKPHRLASVVLNRDYLTPNTGVGVTVTLNSPAINAVDSSGNPQGGEYVRVSYDGGVVSALYQTTEINGAQYLLIPAGQVSAQFTFGIDNVPTNTSGHLYVSLGDETITKPIALDYQSVQSITFSPATAYSGAPVHVTVTLDEPANRGYDSNFNVGPGVSVAVYSVNGTKFPDGSSLPYQVHWVNIPQGETTGTLDIFAPALSAPGIGGLTAYINNTSIESDFNVIPYPTPVLTSLSPNLIAPTPAAVTLTINGSGFTSQTRVPAFGGIFTPSSVTPTQLVVTLPAGIAAAAGNVNISVTNPTPVGGASNTLPLSISNAVISSVKLSAASITAPTAVTGAVTLTAAAPAGGLPVALTSSSSATSVPPSVIVAAGATSATFTITPSPVDSDTPAIIIATTGTVSKTAALTVLAATLKSVTAAASINGGASSTVTVTLTGKAGASGLTIALSSSDGTTIPPGSTVTAPAGATTATFSITPAPVATDTNVTITATQASVVKTVTTIIKAPVIAGLTASASAIAGGGTLTIKAYLSSPAPAGGLNVLVTGSSPAVPGGTIAIAGGATNGSLLTTTQIVDADTAVTMMGTLGTVSKPVAVTVLAAQLKALTAPTIVYGGTASTVTVTLTSIAGPSGMPIILSSSDGTTIPPGTTLTVPAGASTATLSITPTAVTTDTNITITATRGATVKTASMLVKAPAVTQFSASPASVKGRQSSTLTITLNTPAPAGGLIIPVTSNSAVITPNPAYITVAAGTKTGTLVVTPGTVTVNTPVVLTETINGVSKTVTVTVTP